MCAKIIEYLSEEIRQEGYRFTRQRQIILEELRKWKYHPSAKEVYNIVKVRLPNVSLGTVYRSLGVLKELGLIRRLDHGEYSRYETNLSDHYHLFCTKCGQVFDIDTSILEKLNIQNLEANGFQINGHTLELYGLCPNCSH